MDSGHTNPNFDNTANERNAAPPYVRHDSDLYTLPDPNVQRPIDLQAKRHEASLPVRPYAGTVPNYGSEHISESLDDALLDAGIDSAQSDKADRKGSVTELDDDPDTISGPVETKCVNNPPTKQDWKRFRPLIKRLYIDEGHKLASVQEIMEQQYNFKATLDMYSAHRRRWGWRKNLQTKDIVMIRNAESQRIAAGKQTVVMRNGRKLDPEIILRSQKRKRPRVRQLQAMQSTQPQPTSSIAIITPPPSPRLLEAPTEFSRLEQVIRDMKVHVVGSHDLGRPVYDTMTITWPAIDRVHQGQKMVFTDYIYEGIHYGRDGDIARAMTYWRKGFLDLEGLIHTADPGSWLLLLNCCQGLYEGGFAHVARAGIKHVCSLLRMRSTLKPHQRELFIRLLELTDDNGSNPLRQTLADICLRTGEETLGIILPIESTNTPESNGSFGSDTTITRGLSPKPKLADINMLLNDLAGFSFKPTLEKRRILDEVFRRAKILNRIQNSQLMEMYGRECLTIIDPCDDVWEGDKRATTEVAMLWIWLSQAQWTTEQFKIAKESALKALSLLDTIQEGSESFTARGRASLWAYLDFICNQSEIADHDQTWQILLKQRETELQAQVSQL